jgi:hypothetical protein
MLVRLTLLAADSTAALAMNHEGIKVARSIAAGRGFSDPYSCPTGPTAHLAPGYPALTGMLFRLLPSAGGRGVAMGLVASAASSLAWAMLPLLGLQIGAPLSVCVVAGFIGALFPMLPGQEARGAWETSLSTFFAVLCTLLSAQFTQRGRWPHAVMAGAAWGAAFWFAPNLLPMCLVWVVYGLCRPHLRTASAAILLIAVAVISPWIVRNYLQFGRVFWVRDPLGLELRVSNNSTAAPTFVENFATSSSEFHPHGNWTACLQVQAMGEVRYMDLQMKAAIDWIRGHPSGFLKLTGQHIWYFWIPQLPLFRRAITAVCGILGLLGLLISWRYGWHVRIALAAALIAYPALYYFVQSIARYRQPVQPLIALSAAFALEPLWRRYIARGGSANVEGSNAEGAAQLAAQSRPESERGLRATDITDCILNIHGNVSRL